MHVYESYAVKVGTDKPRYIEFDQWRFHACVNYQCLPLELIVREIYLRNLNIIQTTPLCT